MQTIIYTGKKPTIELSETFRNTIEDLINEDNKVVYIDAGSGAIFIRNEAIYP